MKRHLAATVAALALTGCGPEVAGRDAAPDVKSTTAVGRARAKTVSDRIEWLEILIEYGERRWGRGPQDLRFYSLTLQVPTDAVIADAKWAIVSVSRRTGLKLVNALAKDGFFDRARDLVADMECLPGGVYYTLQVSTGDADRPYKYREEIGWDLGTLRRLDSLREVLDGDAQAAMDKLLGALASHRRAWQRAAAEPEYVRAHLPRIEARIRSGDWPLLHREHRELLPLALPHLLASRNRDVVYRGLLLARDTRWSRANVPAVMQVLARLLDDPSGRTGFDRMVACEALGRARDRRAIPVLLRALKDRYTFYDMVATGGHAEHVYRAVWWEADSALRDITGARPFDAPHHHIPPNKEKQRKATTAWENWWRENK